VGRVCRTGQAQARVTQSRTSAWPAKRPVSAAQVPPVRTTKLRQMRCWGVLASWEPSFGADQAQTVPWMERALPRDRPCVGVTHSEGRCPVRTVFHQKQDVPQVQPREECVTLWAGRRRFVEGEAFLGRWSAWLAVVLMSACSGPRGHLGMPHPYAPDVLRSRASPNGALDGTRTAQRPPVRRGDAFRRTTSCTDRLSSEARRPASAASRGMRHPLCWTQAFRGG
jgi:hypothetical protein